MDKKKLEIYHMPTEKSVICLCLNMAQFTSDCKAFTIDRYSKFTVNPEKRFYSKLDKLVDEVIREVRHSPFTFRMRLDSRHCISDKNIHYAFRFADKVTVNDEDFPEEIKRKCIKCKADYVVVYAGVQGE